MKTFLSQFLVSIAAMLLAAQTSVGTPTTQPLPLPTPADLQQMHDAGEFRTCLQQIARVLALRGEAALHYDSSALLLLRGDCLLHLGDRVTALDAYTAAMKSPQPQPPQLAEARATSLLIQNSTGLEFKPKFPPDAASIDIVDHATRKTAMLALKEQIQLENKTLIQSATQAQTLVPILNAVPVLVDLDSLEIAATGANTQIHPTLVAVGDRARELIASELTTIDQRVAAIERKANQTLIVPIGGPWWNATARQGLTTDDREALRNDASYADKITATVSEFQRVARSLGSTGFKWEPILNKSMEVTQHAKDVLLAE